MFHILPKSLQTTSANFIIKLTSIKHSNSQSIDNLTNKLNHRITSTNNRSNSTIKTKMAYSTSTA